MQQASSTGGGLLVAYEADGAVRFREHTDDAHPHSYATLSSTTLVAPVRARRLDEDVDLRVTIAPAGPGQVTVTATAVDRSTSQALASARRTAADAEVRGGVSLVSHAADTKLRSWFGDIRGGGARLVTRPERAYGAIAGILHMVAGGTLKLSAQFQPIGATEPHTAILQRRDSPTAPWVTMATAAINAQWLARFRVAGWDTGRTWDIRVLWAEGVAEQSELVGRVPGDPIGASGYQMAVVSCSSHFARPLDRAEPWNLGLTPGERFPGLYTDVNAYFPYAESVSSVAARNPDVVVFNGDQFYENVPGVIDLTDSGAMNDVVHRILLWHWAFRDLTRRFPSLVLLDDHDMNHPNLWGWAGRPTVDHNTGGYRMPAAWVNAVQAALVGHLPDPFDPTPVQQGIGVYYTAFDHGGISFALLEDRKFKQGDKDGLAPDGTPYVESQLDLLGARQEEFIDWWATQQPGRIRICLHQSPFHCVKTLPTGVPRRDLDSNGYPGTASRRAVSKLAAAGAVLVSGDQHLGAVVHHGINGFADGPWAFSVPALGTLFQRWFEPEPPLPNGDGQIGTGDFTDPFGNRLHISALANPTVPFAAVNDARPGSQLVPDRRLKRDGYAMVVVDKPSRRVTFECYPWDSPPGATAQFPGWPLSITAPAT
ncbi:MAG: alkaline phosphatase D family protein [Acidimicrobiales bacterium]